MSRKGVILAGGKGTRLYPSTLTTSKHLLPIFDKPMIYYPLSALLLAGITDIIIVVNPEHQESYARVVNGLSDIGVSFSIVVQSRPEGIPHAIYQARYAIDDKPFAVILGDNFFYGSQLAGRLRLTSDRDANTIISYPVADPREFGVLVEGTADSPPLVVEKPDRPISNLAVTGYYFFNNYVLDLIPSIKKSQRGEFEIVDIINLLLARGDCNVMSLGRGDTWLDAGTTAGLASISEFVRIIVDRQNFQIACLEEIAYVQGFVADFDVEKIIKSRPPGPYRDYLVRRLSLPQDVKV